MAARVLAYAAAFAALGVLPAAAQIDEVRVGFFLHDVGPSSSGNEDGLAINGEVIFDPPRVLAWAGRPRPHIGFTIPANDEATSQLYAGLGWRQAFFERFYASAGFGLTVHDGETMLEPGAPRLPDTAYLGCRVLARLSGDVGYRITQTIDASIHVSHSSNAGGCTENEGLDATGLRIGYRF